MGLLYGLFQKFIAFDGQFRDRLWADADLPKANKEVRTMFYFTLFKKTVGFQVFIRLTAVMAVIIAPDVCLKLVLFCFEGDVY